jgi:predicted nucleic acid-binding protein
LGWVEKLYGQIVGLDTAPLIYYLEAHATYLPVVDPFFEAVALGNIEIVTSTVTLIEVLTLPLRQGNSALAAQYRQLLLTTQGLSMYPVSAAIAEEAARLRAEYNLRTPDAIQIATTRTAGATAFLTNDTRLAVVADLQVLLLGQLQAANDRSAEESTDSGERA